MHGKPYSLNAAKLLLLKKETASSAAGPADFFCSELVAEALKAVGVLVSTRLSASWWPRDFQDGGRFEQQLHPAWVLGETRELDMEATSFVATKKK
jgi:hypothetical protein